MAAARSAAAATEPALLAAPATARQATAVRPATARTRWPWSASTAPCPLLQRAVRCAGTEARFDQPCRSVTRSPKSGQAGARALDELVGNVEAEDQHDG